MPPSWHGWRGGVQWGWLETIVVRSLGEGGYLRWSVGVSCSTWSQTCGSWNLPRYLFSEASLTLMYMASLIFLLMPWNSLSTIEKQSWLTRCPVVMVWRWMGDALRCSLYLSPNVLPDSPMFSSVQLICGHLYL